MGLRSCSRSQTLSPNSAPRSIPLPRGTPPASVEKPEPTTPPRHSAGGDTPRLVLPACPCHSGPLKYLGFPSAGTRGSDAKQQGPGRQRQRRELHPCGAAAGPCAGLLQTGQVPIRPQGARTQKKGIFRRSLLHRWTLLFLR